MSKKKVLIIGASENVVSDLNQTYHYATLIQQHYNVDVVNAAMGAMSNEEIFYRCIGNIEQDQYDCVIVMWSDLDRKWIYFGDNNVDDETIIRSTFIKGLRSTDPMLLKYHKLHWAYFNNRYISLRNWLCQVVALQNTLKNKKIPCVMIHDFDNCVSDLLKFDPNKEEKLPEFSNEFKQLLDFDNRPDEYIKEKVGYLAMLMNKIDRSNWIDFENFRFNTSKVDRSKDKYHAGPLSHKKFFERLIDCFDKQNIKF